MFQIEMLYQYYRTVHKSVLDTILQSWAAIPLRFQWKKVNEDDSFGPGFNSTSSDWISKIWFKLNLSQLKNLIQKTLKDTQREKTPLNKTQSFTKSMNMDILVVGTLNQLSIRGSYTEIKFSKK